jgi:hypothetical protein
MAFGNVRLDPDLVTHLRGHSKSTPPPDPNDIRLRQARHAR